MHDVLLIIKLIISSHHHMYALLWNVDLSYRLWLYNTNNNLPAYNTGLPYQLTQVQEKKSLNGILPASIAL